MKITILDSATLGSDLTLNMFDELGTVCVYPSTSHELVAERITDSDIIIVNKIVLNESNLQYADSLKLICVTATGYDNIDISYCKSRGIAVCNVAGYSSESVALVTAALVTSLNAHLTEYRRHCVCGEYTRLGVQNHLVPVYHELSSMTWGIVGLGNIGRRVMDIARAFGANVIVCKRTPEDGIKCVDIDTLCSTADIITIHTPLNDSTRNLINKDRIASMKNNVIVVNTARGAVVDEAALAEAVKQSRIGGIGVDVYSLEPYPSDSPYAAIADMDNVILTPHMAWGAYESRVRCMNEIVFNIKAFLKGETRNRVDI